MIFHEYSFGSRVLGEGFSSIVYKGKKNKSKQQFAIKLIKEDFFKSQFEKNLLVNEISVHELVSNHKNFVKLIEHGKYEKNYVFVMELCQKGSLGDFLQKNKKLTEVQAIDIIKEVIEAYRFLHSLKILHRDIKPGNILLTSKNQVKLCDFGLSLRVHEAQQTTNIRIGTPCFMAPQVAMKKQFTPKSDIWSIGVTYFAMITGQLPYKSQNYDKFLKQIEQNPLSSILPKELSSFSKLFLEKTLQKDPIKRMSPKQMFNFQFSSGFVQLEKPDVHGKSVSKIKSPRILQNTTNFIQNERHKSFKYDKSTVNDNNKIQKSFRVTQETQSSQRTQKMVIQDDLKYETPKFFKIGNKETSPLERSTPIKKNINFSIQKNHISSDKKIETPRNKQFEKILMKQMQKITKVILNQIDFLRYTVKILSLIKKNFKSEVMQLNEMMKQFVCVKFVELKKLHFIEKEKIKQYQKYPIYNEWRTLVQEYEKSLNFVEKGKFRLSEFQKLLQKNILEIYLSFDKSLKTKPNAEKLLVLDHLICYRDLIKMSKKGQGHFLKNSMLNLILQGIENMVIQPSQIQAIYMGITRKLTGSDFS